jgi:hypothetical protein
MKMVFGSIHFIICLAFALTDVDIFDAIKSFIIIAAVMISNKPAIGMEQATVTTRKVWAKSKSLANASKATVRSIKPLDAKGVSVLYLRYALIFTKTNVETATETPNTTSQVKPLTNLLVPRAPKATRR